MKLAPSARDESRGRSNPRVAAARCLNAVLNGHSLDAVMAGEAPQTGQPFFKALVFESVRWQPRLGACESVLLERPLSRKDSLVSALIQVALCELMVMGKPAHAVVSESVDAARALGRPRLAGLVNAVLRRYIRERESIEVALAGDPVAVDSHPAWWRQHFQSDWPQDADRIIAAGNRQAPMWLRVNSAKCTVASYLEDLKSRGLAAVQSRHAANAVCLEQAMPVETTPGFALGLVSVQDAAAQLAAPMLAAKPGMRVLDACAAPGGKTAHLLELAGGDLDLLALDQDSDRLARVGENLDRLSFSASLAVADARDRESWWDGRPFDRILLDVPCSGSGVIRRHPDIKLLRRPGDPGRLAVVQKELLHSLWPMLEPGGILLYCSCSVFKLENQDLIEAFLNASPDAELRPLSASLSDSFGGRRGPGMQILPGEDGMDGFFYAALQKTGTPKQKL